MGVEGGRGEGVNDFICTLRIFEGQEQGEVGVGEGEVGITVDEQGQLGITLDDQVQLGQALYYQVRVS